MNDPWASMLRTMECEYDTLKEVLEDGPKVSVQLKKNMITWSVTIHEDWKKTSSEIHYQYYTADYKNITERTEWAEEQLQGWPLVSKQGDHSWTFVRKRDAEKFVTLFNLIWT